MSKTTLCKNLNPLFDYIDCIKTNNKNVCYKRLQQTMIDRNPITLCEEKWTGIIIPPAFSPPSIDMAFTFDIENVSPMDQETYNRIKIEDLKTFNITEKRYNEIKIEILNKWNKLKL